MFRGLHNINLDVKGRLAIPAKCRELLCTFASAHLVATIDTDDKCLLIYPVHEWEVIEQKLSALPTFDPNNRRVQRLLLGHAADLEPDGNGRVLLPQSLRDYAQLEKEVVLIGQGKKMELWSKSVWDSRRDEYLNDTASGALSEQLMSLSL